MKQQMTDETIGGILYDTYCSAVGYTAHNGFILPEWEDFKEDPDNSRQVIGWCAVAAAAKDMLI